MSGTAVILGAGVSSGVGGATARRFAAEGCHVIVTGRTLSKVQTVADEINANGGSAEALQVDVTSPVDQDALFKHAEQKAPIAAVIFNAGNNAIISFDDLTEEQFETFWRIGCYGAFLTAKRAMPLLEAQGSGSLLFTGASGSLRGKANFAHFAAMKAGLRMLSQSLAREYGPKGIHVGHVIVDGIVDGERTRNFLATYMDKLGEDGVLSPEGIADAFWFLHQQERSTWTQELDLRPYSESW